MLPNPCYWLCYIRCEYSFLNTLIAIPMSLTFTSFNTTKGQLSIALYSWFVHDQFLRFWLIIVIVFFWCRLLGYHFRVTIYNYYISFHFRFHTICSKLIIEIIYRLFCFKFNFNLVDGLSNYVYTVSNDMRSTNWSGLWKHLLIWLSDHLYHNSFHSFYILPFCHWFVDMREGMKNRENNIGEYFYIYYDCLMVVLTSELKFIFKS